MNERFELPDGEKRRLALVVGVDRAPEVEDFTLKPQLHASEDAAAMASVLKTYCGFELYKPPFINQQARSDAIRDAIIQLEKDSHRDDFLLFYFSGHGHFLQRRPNTNSPDRVNMYLVTYDFSETRALLNDDSFLSLRWLSGESLFRSRHAGKVLIILDSCYAGYFGLASPSEVSETVHSTFNTLFEQPKGVSRSLQGGFRKALLATGPTQAAREENLRGLMTSKLIEALSGKVDSVINTAYYEGVNLGDVTYSMVHTFLENVMPRTQKPNDSGGSAGTSVILARHEGRAEELLGTIRPSTYIRPIPRYSFFARPDEEGLFQQLKALKDKEYRMLGLIGQTGVGKTWLAHRLAERCERERLYPDGIFWLDVEGDDDESLFHQLDVLIQNADYRPPQSERGTMDPVHWKRTRFIRYLSRHRDALLIIDNLQSSKLINTILPRPDCAILYTADEPLGGNTEEIYAVEPFPMSLAMKALLQGVRSDVLRRYEDDCESQDENVIAARKICTLLERLPMHLDTAHAQLERDPGFSLFSLLQWLQSPNVFNELPDLKIPLEHDWQRLTTNLQDVFLLTLFSSDAAPIPLWLLKLVAGYSEEAGTSSNKEQSMSGALEILKRTHWIEISGQEQAEEVIPATCLRRQFGRYILQRDEQHANHLCQQAGKRLAEVFLDLNTLSQRIEHLSYWTCLEHVRQAHCYAHLLKQPCAEDIGNIERWLDRESSLLASGTKKWERQISLPSFFYQGLCYQQLYNRAVEEGRVLSGQQPQRWLRLECPIGAEDRALQRVLGGHEAEVRCVAVTPDGQLVLTGSNDHTAIVWESATGKVLSTFRGHTANVTCAAFSIDGRYAITGSEDETVRIWEWQTGSELWTLSKHNAAITRIVCMSDGAHLVTASNDHTVCIWNIDSGDVVKECRVESHVHSLVVTRDCQQVIFAGGKNLWQWHWQREAAPLPPRVLENIIASLALTADDRYLAVGFLDPPVISIWDMRQQFWRQPLSGHTRWLNDVAFSHDGRWLVSGAEDEIACVWDYLRGTCNAILLGHIGSTTSVAFSRDGRWLITGSTNHTVGIWNATAALEMQPLPFINTHWSRQKQNGAVHNIRRAREALPRLGRQAAVSPNGRYAFLFASNGAELWETEERRRIAGFEHWQVRCVTFLADNESCLVELQDDKCLLRCTDGKVSGWQEYKDRFHVNSREASSRCQYAPETNNVSIVTPFRKYTIENTEENLLVCWDKTRTGKKSVHWQCHIGSGRITHLGFSDDERLFTVGNIHGCLFFLEWDGRTLGHLAGMYQAFDPIVAVHWFDREHVMVVDASPAGLPPHFHRLQLEGSWGSTRILRW
jgi:WD40 repeat protein